MLPFTAQNLLPPGSRWALGISGGADSVALLRLLHARRDLKLHVVHLDHQTRGPESTGDAVFVAELAASLGLPCTICRRDEIEPTVKGLPANPSARFRALRLALFREVIASQGLEGVGLAHHADDLAETIFHRLLRGSGPAGLTGIDDRVTVSGVTIVRPLLSMRRDDLRTHLLAIGQPWREDPSNASPRYTRNRLRRVLRDAPALAVSLHALGDACRGLRDWTRRAAPTLHESFRVEELRGLPELLAQDAARRWLIARGAPAEEASPDTLARLMEMATDAAAPSSRHFPGGLLVRRRAGRIFINRAMAEAAASPVKP